MDQNQASKRDAIRAAIAAQLRAERAAKGLTQVETARLAGVSESTIIRIEQGKRDLPVALLFELARVLDFEPGVFMDAAQARYQR
ncbi:helix-turn-helix domain-containing protein [Propionibacterium phage B22]|nr:helix-turn-helix transcriptional regulator [Propionibacterium freudenreichii]YP_009596834.1 helix-turn-helix domain-containing protein [Propionibacterium phage B22]YP_009596894.1 helix-turn-helix domain-containing protein [Propionibacterium phage B3]YP_009596954.1 helix-turn-helix domain-containing protein [Propionibacterium phage Doucette]AOT24323.1 repressor [Propionibacterium phage B3]AOT24383.1 immunity repressor [Propionibacterium phage B22]AOT24446.1 immunity repressor [Propionibacte